jgi:hypothetical protein
MSVLPLTSGPLAPHESGPGENFFAQRSQQVNQAVPERLSASCGLARRATPFVHMRTWSSATNLIGPEGAQ